MKTPTYDSSVLSLKVHTQFDRTYIPQHLFGIPHLYLISLGSLAIAILDLSATTTTTKSHTYGTHRAAVSALCSPQQRPSNVRPRSIRTVHLCATILERCLTCTGRAGQLVEATQQHKDVVDDYCTVYTRSAQLRSNSHPSI